jgi:hypothetical protein
MAGAETRPTFFVYGISATELRSQEVKKSVGAGFTPARLGFHGFLIAQFRIHK